jgi:PST family polysaccharide transporter
VAGVLGTQALGFYYLAARIPIQLYQLGAGASVSFLTAFSRSDEHQLERGFATATKLSAFFVVAPLAVVIPLGRPLIETIFGETWRPAAAPFVLLLAAIAVRFTFWHVWNKLKSRGRVREIATVTAAQFVVVAIGAVVGAYAAGVTGAAAAVLLSELAFIPQKLRLARTLVRVDLARIVGPPLATLCVACAASALLAAVLPNRAALLGAAVLAAGLTTAAAWLDDAALFGAVLSSFRSRYGT